MNLYDDFNRADSTTVIGTPSDGGPAWVVGSGSWGINSNQLYCSVSESGAYVTRDAGTNALDFSLKLNGSPYNSLSPVNGLYFRFADVDNTMFLNFSGRMLGLRKKVGGVKTTIGTDYTGATGTIVTGDVISVSVTAGGLITVKQNGITRITHSDNANSANTKIGVFTNSFINYRYDDLVVLDLNLVTSIPVILNTRRDL